MEKAIEFVKKFGWKEAQICLLNCAMPQDKWFMHRGNLIECQDFDDLKQIVEAFEIIDLFKSLNHAKLELTACEADIHSQILVKLDVGIGYIDTKRVKKAIELVGSVDGS